jgi:hypothetical protein
MASMNDVAVEYTDRWQPLVVVVFCACVVATGVAASTLLGPRMAPSAVTLGDVAEAQIVEIRTAGGETVLSGEFRDRVDALGNTEKDAALADRAGRRVVGEVELEIPGSARPHRRPELEVDVMGLPARTTFLVVIDDRVVATFRTDDRGSVDMELQEGEVPTATAPF